MSISHKLNSLRLKISAIKEYYRLFMGFLIFVYESIYETVTEHPVYVFLQNLKLPQRIFPRRNPVVQYFSQLINTFLEATLLVITTGILSYIIYYIFDLFWYLYTSTPMGQKFISIYPKRAETIFELSNMNLRYFCVEVTLSAFVICFLIGVICRFLYISHYLYLSRGLFGKLVFWGLPLTATVSYYIKNEYGFSDWGTTGFIVMFPTYLLFCSCFKYSQKLIPEIGDVLKLAGLWIKKGVIPIYYKITALILNKRNR